MGDSSVNPLKLAKRKTPSVHHPLQISLTELSCHRRGGNPLVHHGRHFGRTVHAMCNLPSLISRALSRMAVEDGVAEETLTFEFVPVFLVSTTSELMSLSITGKGGSVECSNNLRGLFPI
jgi:hypothetical protein